jgi:hypothetical protein
MSDRGLEASVENGGRPFVRSRYEEAVVTRYPVVESLGMMPDRFETGFSFPYVRIVTRYGAPILIPGDEFSTTWTKHYEDEEDNVFSWATCPRPAQQTVLAGFLQAVASPISEEVRGIPPLAHILTQVTDVDTASVGVHLGDIERVYMFNEHVNHILELAHNAETNGAARLWTSAEKSKAVDLPPAALYEAVKKARPALVYPRP